MSIEELTGYVADYRYIETIDRRIKALEEALERTTTRLNGMPHGSDGSDKMASLIATIVDLKTKLDERRIEAEAGMQKVDAVLDALPAQQKTVMRLRFVDCLPWEGVSKKTHWSVSYLFKIRNAALERMKKGDINATLN